MTAGSGQRPGRGLVPTSPPPRRTIDKAMVSEILVHLPVDLVNSVTDEEMEQIIEALRRPSAMYVAHAIAVAHNRKHCECVIHKERM